ncbi:MAG: archaeal heat shock protein Hsp20 [Candidatus Nitrosocosmicus sp.]
MSIRDIDPYDWFKRFFGSGSRGSMRGGFSDRRDIFREFEDMQEEMSRMFNQFNDISSNPPKELVREYQTPEGDKVREIGPIVYGYSMTIGPDGKPHVREFGNVKSLGGSVSGGTGFAGGNVGTPQITAEREPLADVNTSDNEVKVVLEMPGIKKEDIKINAYDGAVEVTANDPQRKYHKKIELPHDADIETARSIYNNGVLEVTFNKKRDVKPKGKEIKID